MRIFLFIGIAAVAFACNTTKHVSDAVAEEELVEETDTLDVLSEEELLNAENTNPDPNIDGKPQRPYQVRGEFGDVNQRTDAYNVLSAKIVGNKLLVDISYTGGCAHHKFKCVGSQAISKSLPPQRAIKLIHDNDNDVCESLVNQTIEIDIQPYAFSAAGRSEIVLILDGYSQELNYINE